MCYARNNDPCAFDGIIPSHMFFQCPVTNPDISVWLSDYGSWYFILWFASR